MASSPISPDTFAAAFLLRPGVRFEPVVQVRFCERPEVYSDNDDDILTGTLLSSDSDAESPMNDTSCRQGASRETTTKRLSSSSVSGWQGIVLETSEMLWVEELLVSYVLRMRDKRFRRPFCIEGEDLFHIR